MLGRSLIASVCAITMMVPCLSAELTSNNSLEDLLRKADEADHVSLHEIGRSVADRPIWAIHAQSERSGSQTPCTALLIGQQHGDEPAGCEALLALIENIANDSAILRPELDLWIVPRMNPDGAELNQRRNGNRADLNRDHLILSQPETKALYSLVQKIRPHLAVDCHEFYHA
jgi:murein tripeptide amidase MpaA